jgi:hypothetical protein
MQSCENNSCDEYSWQRAKDLLVQVATHGENIGHEVPCLIVVAKDDLDQSSQALQGSTRVMLLCICQLVIDNPSLKMLLSLKMNNNTSVVGSFICLSILPLALSVWKIGKGEFGILDDFLNFYS